MSWLCKSLLLIMLLASSGSYAALKLELADSALNDAQKQASQQLIKQAFAALPPKFIQQLDRSVAIEWQPLPSEIYGQAGRFSGITLNQRLLPALVDGSAATQTTQRPHGTVRKELLATLIHELTHLYDRERLWSAAERQQFRHCQQRAHSSGLVGLPDGCRGQTERRFTLSDDPRLLDLAGWQQYVGRRGEREDENHQNVRSPDEYELTNPLEFVAVNMEYYLLDPTYACRRPSLAAYFNQHFNWSPRKQTACGNELAYLNAGSDFAREPLGMLDPERVYEVDYLLAEANDALASRWGHSMLRLVICAPGRPRGPACRLDLDQHLVLSYRAFLGDVQLSSWGALVGQYPSRLFVLPLAQVIDEYTKTELRSLASVPLKLDRQEINDLVTRSLELHWSYDGDYFFLSNNCAVETLKLIRTGGNQAPMQSLDSIMPNGLLEVLDAHNLADNTVLDDRREAMRLGYWFDSYRDRYQKMFEVLHERLNIPQKAVEDWLTLPATERRAWFEKADMRASAAMLLLEKAAQRKQLLLAQDELKQRYLSGNDSNDPSLEKAGNALEQLLANSGFLSRPAELLSSGYGLPQPSELDDLRDSSSSRQQLMLRFSEELNQEVRNLLDPERLAEMEAIGVNLKQLANHLHEVHKANGGLMLP